MKIEIPITDNITLRTYTTADAPALLAAVEANRAHLLKWFPWPEFHTSVQDSVEFIESLNYDDPYSHFGMGVFDGDEVIGSVGLVRGEAFNKKSEIGYWLAENRQGEGIITKSVVAMLKLAFNTFGMHRIEIRPFAPNQRSKAIPERLGFQLEGIEREAVVLNGAHVDILLYSILAHEFSAE